MWLILISLAVPATLGQGYGPDPPHATPEWMCAWRQISYDYATKLRPDASALIRDALQLEEYCNSSALQPHSDDVTHFLPSKSSLADGDIYVDAKSGSDSNDGTLAKPLKTIQKAIDISKAGDTVLLRAGTFYLEAPVQVTEKNSGLTIAAYQGEEAWVSGGTLLNGLEWEKYQVDGKYNIWKTDVSSFNLQKVEGLRVNGRRASPGRFPNADPETQFWPTGYLTSKTEDWLAPKISPKPNPAKEVMIESPNRDFDAQFSHYGGGIGGTCSIYDPPFSFWCASNFSQGCGGCFTWRIPGGFSYGKQLNKTYQQDTSNPALFMAWRKAHWANWAFEVENFDFSKKKINFGKGGFQGARGGTGSDWFVMNLLEEVDTPNEYYFHQEANTLYYFANNTDGKPPQPDDQFVALTQHTLFNATGQSQANPLKDFTISHVGFRDSAWTMLQPHGVPSGGDWALERIGAIYLENTENTNIEYINMTRLGGNGIMISKYNLNAEVKGCSFEWLGGSAVAAWGWTDEISDGGIHGIDGTGGHFPTGTKITNNLFREIGVWEKQSSAFFQAKTAKSIVRWNVVFNLARAGFNFNDGFGGGDLVHENVLFNTCRESSDHGPINSWDRQPFLTNVSGKATTQMLFRNISNNVVIANYGGVKEVDNDDGSLFYRISNNFMSYGWGQKFKCGAIESSNNVKAFIDLGAKLDAGGGCLLNNQSVFYPNKWNNDTMIVLAPSATSTVKFPYRSCWSSPEHPNFDKTRVYDNTIVVPNAQSTAIIDCGKKKYTLQEFQAQGNEPGTKLVTAIPPIPDIVQKIKDTVGPMSPNL